MTTTVEKTEEAAGEKPEDTPTQFPHAPTLTITKIKELNDEALLGMTPKHSIH